jgi:hypothetical protein
LQSSSSLPFLAAYSLKGEILLARRAERIRQGRIEEATEAIVTGVGRTEVEPTGAALTEAAPTEAAPTEAAPTEANERC